MVPALRPVAALLLIALTAGPAALARDTSLTPRPAAFNTHSDIVLDRAVFVERTKPDGSAHLLEPARSFARGDRVVTLLTWYRLGGSGGFTVTNALPAPLAYQPGDGQDEVSVDGGRTWGRLATLHVGQRSATAQDITHVRWHITPAQAMAGSGRIAYAGLVR